MKSWKEDDDQNWSNNMSTFNFDADNRKHNFGDISKFSVRSARQAPVPIQSPGLMSAEPLSFSTLSESDLEHPTLTCHTCQKLIVDNENCKYEGNKVFTNDMCWQHWLDKMTENEPINVKEFCSLAARRYCLKRVSSSCNGQLILKVTLELKAAMHPSQFESLLSDNPMACNNYIAFLKETGQTDPSILRISAQYKFDVEISSLRKLFSDNARVSDATVNQYMVRLNEFRMTRLLSLNIPLDCEMIKEYVSLLDWQSRNNKEYINAPLIETLIGNKISYQAIRDSSRAKYLKETFKVTPEEFVWSTMRTIFDENNLSEIDNVFNNKNFGNRPVIPFQRVVAYLVFLNKEPDEMKMKCLSKISNISELVDCANMWKLLPAYVEFCTRNKDHSQVKKIHQLMQGYKR